MKNFHVYTIRKLWLKVMKFSIRISFPAIALGACLILDFVLMIRAGWRFQRIADKVLTLRVNKRLNEHD